MCRNIRPLFNFEPPAMEEEIRAASRQFVRKISGFAKPSRANVAAFEVAVDEITATTRRLLASLETASPPKQRAGDPIPPAATRLIGAQRSDGADPA